jgi:D-beta-D-heptose 7-phosphate kinase/D-beta-D-heptose 1-phosphate adenosyltransferase
MSTLLPYNRAKALVGSFKQRRILVVGDLMLDRFVWGRVNRISPEAPVPVVEVTDESVYPGGAANVARNLREFCDGVTVMGSVGPDRAGAELRELLESCNIETSALLQDSSALTTLKTRVIARNQQVVRYDRERCQAPSPATLDQAFEKLDELMLGVDAVIAEDYDKGFLSQTLANQIVTRAKAHSKLLCVDPNPRSHVQWRGASCMKPNRGEAYAAAGIPLREPFPPPLEDPELLEVGRRLQQKWETERLLITLGENGMALFDPDGSITHSPAFARKIFDVSGAGDTAIAVFTLALACGASGLEAMDLANAASGIAVGKLGTAIVSPEELVAEFEPRS